MRGETNNRVFGAVYFRMPPKAYFPIPYWIEHLVHEVSHLKLGCLRAHDPNVLNDLECKYKAPFRRDPRPMLGVFHATFVIARMLHVIALIHKRTGEPFFVERYDYLFTRYLVGRDEIGRYGELTPGGALMRKSFDDMLAIH